MRNKKAMFFLDWTGIIVLIIVAALFLFFILSYKNFIKVEKTNLIEQEREAYIHTQSIRTFAQLEIFIDGEKMIVADALNQYYLTLQDDSIDEKQRNSKTELILREIKEKAKEFYGLTLIKLTLSKTNEKEIVLFSSVHWKTVGKNTMVDKDSINFNSKYYTLELPYSKPINQDNIFLKIYYG
ncbi:MAG: hypothetical protein AB7V77_03110 [Candidatus Woesearchaeota archaeon]